jgi:hypothetical protein
LKREKNEEKKNSKQKKTKKKKKKKKNNVQLNSVAAHHHHHHHHHQTHQKQHLLASEASAAAIPTKSSVANHQKKQTTMRLVLLLIVLLPTLTLSAPCNSCSNDKISLCAPRGNDAWSERVCARGSCFVDAVTGQTGLCRSPQARALAQWVTHESGAPVAWNNLTLPNLCSVDDANAMRVVLNNSVTHSKDLILLVLTLPTRCPSLISSCRCASISLCKLSIRAMMIFNVAFELLS